MVIRMSEPQLGHNGQLKALVERIENVNEQIKELTDDRGEIFQEAKSNGYCIKTLRKVIAIRKKDPSERAEEEALLETYMSALGE
jgi:uncharacterized protein (UPF0335 family)